MFKTVALISIIALANSAPAFAQANRGEITSATVAARGLDFANPRDVRELHALLRRAAQSVCDSHMPRQLSAEISDQRCARQSLDRAVADLGQPMLRAYHAGQPVVSQTRRLALAQP